MTTLFNRYVELIIGKPGEPGKKITGLRVQFKIQKGTTSSSNTSTISIFNMNNTSRGFVEDEGLDVILRAGSLGIGETPVLDAIFTGDVKRTSNKKNGTDIITTLEVVSAQRNYTTKHIEENFGEGAKTEQVLKKILGKFGLSETGVNRVIQRVKDKGISQLNKQYLNGLSMTGNFKAAMDKVLNYEQLEWNIDDNQINIDKDTIDPNDAVVVSQNTGLLDIPIKREKGIEVNVIIQPGFRIGKTIKIVSNLITGFYKIRQIVYQGDSQQGAWKAKIIAK